MVSSAHDEYETPPPPAPITSVHVVPPGKFFCLFSQWNGWHVPDVTQGIYFSEKAAS